MLALIIIGSILLAASVGFSTYKTIVMCRTHKKGTKNQNQLKDLIITAISTAVSGLGGIALIFGLFWFYERPVTPGHTVEAVIGSLFFFPSLTWFIYTLAMKHFKLDMEEKVKRIVKLTNVITVFSTLAFFVLMMDGVAPYITYPLYNSIQFGGENGFLGKPGEAGGGFSIAFYAICILSGAVLVYILCDHRFYKIYGKHGMLESVFLTAFPAGIIGARLWFCFVLEWDKYSKWDGTWEASNNPFAIWDGGLAIMGGALLGIIVGVLWVIFVKKEIKIRQAIDIIVPTILIAQAVGRWGNFFNLEVYGAAKMTLAEGWWIPSFIKYNMVSIVDPGFKPFLDANANTLFNVPLFYVEFITNLAGYYFIRYLFEAQLLFKGIAKVSNKIASKTKHGPLSEKTYNTIATCFPKGGCAGMYLIWYGFTRLFLEPLREASYEYQASSDSAVVLICLGVGVIALFAIYQYAIEPRWPFYKSRRKKYEALEIAAANASGSIEVENSEENNGESTDESSKNAAEPKDFEKKKKSSDSLNDEF